MNISIGVLICLVIYFTHAWMLLSHPIKMGDEKTDRPLDPLFSKLRQYFAFFAILGLQLYFLIRRIELELGNSGWHSLFWGSFIFILGFSLRLWAIRILGRLFTFEIGIRSHHTIIENGPYKWIRHPSYTGYLLMLIGMGIAYESVLFTMLMISGSLSFLILRMNQEEKMLTAHFGKPYREYISRTKRLVPYLY